MPSELWGRQSNMGSGTRTSGGYRGQEYGTGVPNTLQREDIAAKRRKAMEQAAALEAAPPSAPPQTGGIAGFGPTARDFATPSMSPQGVLGWRVNPLDVPIAFQGQVPTGFFAEGSAGNYSYSPTVTPGR